MKTVNIGNLAVNIKRWAENLGFQDARITNVDLSAYENSFKTWIKNKFHETFARNYSSYYGSNGLQKYNRKFLTV